MKISFNKIIAFSAAFVACITPALYNIVYGGTFVSPIGNPNLRDLLNQIVDIVILIAFPIIVLMLVYTGFLFVQAQGNPSKIAEAKKVFVWTLIGAFVILAARTIQEVVVATVEEL